MGNHLSPFQLRGGAPDARQIHNLAAVSSILTPATKSLKGKCMGYVYLIGSPRYKWYKIGKSTNVTVRISDLRILLPFRIDIIAIWKSSGHGQLESQLHRRLAGNRINGEWFSLTRDEVKALVIDMAHLAVNDLKMDCPNVEEKRKPPKHDLSDEECDLRRDQWIKFAKDKKGLSPQERLKYKADIFAAQRARSGELARMQILFDKFQGIPVPLGSR